MTVIAPERRWTNPPTQPANRPQPPGAALRCPDTPLGRARAARGWSQAKAVRALLVTARQWGWDVAAESSLKVLLHRWENEQHRPGETYRVLLSTIYQTTPEGLGFTDTDLGSPPRTVTVKGQRAATQELHERVASLEDLVRQLSDRLMAVTQAGAA